MVAIMTLLCTIYIYMNIVPVKLTSVLFHITFLKKYPSSTAVLKHCIQPLQTYHNSILHIGTTFSTLSKKIHYRSEMKSNMGSGSQKKGKKKSFRTAGAEPSVIHN